MSPGAQQVLEQLANHGFRGQLHLLDRHRGLPEVELLHSGGVEVPKFTGEFWTSKQRQASSIHEISYRACFKPQLPRFFIELLTSPGDTVYDPFAGRGTTPVEAALLGRKVMSNDANPLSLILLAPRLMVPELPEVKKRLREIPMNPEARAEVDLSMFYHPGTEAEIVSLRHYLRVRKASGEEDHVDMWIRMVATNRLTGHSKGFFSVYTLPPNQAVSPEKQREINRRLGQVPEYRDTRTIILKKTKRLLSGLSQEDIRNLRRAYECGMFLCKDARATTEIPSAVVDLTVTSPPFLDVVQYTEDNWLRCWFNDIESEQVSKRITCTGSLSQWREVMKGTLAELYRITKPGGWVAFEVGEVKSGRLNLDEEVLPLGMEVGFVAVAVVVNRQSFTKTSNIWGVENHKKGTNTNRIVLFRKE